MVKKNTELTFEESLNKLENIVNEVESGQVDLEKAIELYEQGEKLKKTCQLRLDKAKLKVEKIISSSNGSLEVEDFSA